MFPGIGKPHKLSVIKSSGGILKGPMQHLPWRDKVLLEKAFLVFSDGSKNHRLFLPGAIFRPNRQLAKRTKDASTHIIYEDLYAAERGAKHAVVNYGARTKGKYTEIEDLETTVKTLREYVLFLLAQGPHFEHVLRDLSLGMDQLIAEYSWKIDDFKKKATVDMIRGLLERDSLGRRNPSASAMAMGGAIWNLLEREEAVQWLDMHMDMRAVQTERLIAAHISLYQKLWDLIGKDSAIKALVESRYDETRPTRFKISQIHDQMQNVRLRPFVKNAKHTVHDMAEVLDLLSRTTHYPHEEQKRIDALKRLKEGVRWVFVLDALQRGIIFPLSYLIDDLLRAERAKRKRTGQKDKPRYVPISSKMAPEKFADLSERIYEFREKLKKCVDEIEGEKILEHPVKDAVLALLGLAQVHLAEDDWRKVKTDLDAIAQIL